MFNKKLINTISESKKYIVLNVLFQWIILILNISLMYVLAVFLNRVLDGDINNHLIIEFIISGCIILLGRYFCSKLVSIMSYMSAKSVKKVLRTKIFEKLLRLGASYTNKVTSSELVQITVEGVEQLEIYFGSYLPQLIYSIIAPSTLFILLSFVNLSSALVLLICTPMIPIAIAAIQTIAKKLFLEYWGEYTNLGDTFLENLQGLTTLKIYQADEYKNNEMNYKAEQFRKTTMKVLFMQLNSVIVMDIIAFGGAAIGMIISITQYNAGKIDLSGCLFIIFLSADFFIPMRQLGSFFHIAMNGIAASDKIFRFLDLHEPNKKSIMVPKDNYSISIQKLRFSYNLKEVLHGIDLFFAPCSITAIVGESGCGKTTIASIIFGENRNYSGIITIGDIFHYEISEESLMQNITYISYNSYIFKGTVRDNLLMAAPNATENQLWEVIKKCQMDDFLKNNEGLDTRIHEKGINLSGGQRQRIALARGLLHDTPIYIFDEATSNIDIDSENIIMNQIYQLSNYKTVLLITHRLLNVVNANMIYVLEKGSLIESGTHSFLLKEKGVYANQWCAQQTLENYRKVGV